MSTFQHINNNTGVRNLGQKLILVCNSIKLYVKELLIANRTFTISSGTDFHTNENKVNVKHELELFEQEVTKIVNQLVWKESQYIKTKNIFVRFRLLQKSSFVKNNPEICLLLTSILKSYKKERVLFKRQLRNKNYGNLKTQHQIEVVFKPNSDQILVAADKNVGYVCMDKTDLLA